MDNSLRLLVGYDGSLAANAAIAAGASLIPRAHAHVTYLWAPPFGSESLRQQLRLRTANVNEFIAALEREGEAEADQLTATGTTLARAAGWTAEPIVRRSYSGEGLAFAQLAAELKPDLILLGSRGLSGTKAMLGSVSDTVVHYAPTPVLVIAHPLLTAARATLAGGPIVIGWDGSTGARAALDTTARLFPQRELLAATVGDSATVDGATVDSATVDGAGVDVVRLDSDRGSSSQAVADTLIAFARTRGAAVVVVGSRGRSVAKEIVLGGVARTTLHHTHGAVMVVPQPAR